VGAILSADPSAANAVASLFTAPGNGVVMQRGAGARVSIQNVWEAVASLDMGGMDVGFGFMYGNANNDTSFTAGATNGESEATANMMGFRGGVNFDLGSGNSFDAAAAFRLDNAEDNVTTNAGSGGEYSASGTEVQVSGRLKWKMSNKVNFVPYAMFATASADLEEDAVATGGTASTGSYEVNAMALAIGAGMEYRTPTFYMAGGVSFQTASAELETNTGGATPTSSTVEVSYTAIPVLNIGGEWWFTDWLAGRGGYYRSLGSLKREYNTTTPAGSTSGEANTTVPNSFLAIGGITPGNFDGLITLGLGFRFGGFALDATVSEQALRRGLGLIGAQDNINTFGYITTSYNFGE
jgi:hypothetical protein